MNEPLISVIVPVYNVEPYLDRCVESIVNQTYRKLEIILVDDGSPDNCPQMCDAWAERDARIQVIHKENGGLSDARNIGMSIASGELMGFVDSDDLIREDMYRLLYDNMTANDSDISCCGVKMIFDDGSPERMLTRESCCVLEAEDIMRAVIKEDWLKQPVWYKLYKTGLVKDIQFPVGKYHEDVFWTYRAVGNAKRVSIFDEPCYYYRQRGGSIMGEEYSPKRLDSLKGKWQMLEYIHKTFPILESEMRVNLWFSCMYHYQQVLRQLPKTEQKSLLTKIISIKNISRVSVEDFGILPFKQKMWLFMGIISFDGTCRLRNKMKMGV